MVVKNECSSFYNRVGDFSISLERKFIHWWISMHGRTEQPTPECAVNGTECYCG